jgi:hypothetical protein
MLAYMCAEVFNGREHFVPMLWLQVSLTNPSDKPLHLRAVYGCCTLLGPASFVAPAGPGAQATFECFYAPLAQGQEEGVLRLVSKEVCRYEDLGCV